MKHETTVRRENRPGMASPEFRVRCIKPDCNWQEKAISFDLAQARGKNHERKPH